MEKPAEHKPEYIDDRYQKLSGKDKVEVILNMFGSESAKNNFVSLCKQYVATRGVAPQSQYGENYLPYGKERYSPPRRAALHNRLMETLTKLATQLREISPLERKVLNELHSRENAAQIIKAYVLSLEDREEDEDELERRKQRSSETSYFHTLGREH